MATGGKPVGTMVVELDLDATKYTKAQQAILAGAEKNSADINRVMATVGTKSDTMYNAMRQNVQNALAAIQQSTLTSAAERVRAEEGAAAKIKAINEAQFGKQVSLIESIKANWLGMAAVATAAFYAVKSAVAAPIEAYMESEQALMKMGMAMANQGDFTREALKDMQEYSEQIQKTTTVEHDAALAIMANLKSYGLSNEQVKEATRAALDLAAAKANEGMSIERASEIIGKSYLGISTGLKRLGIQVDETAGKSELFNSVLKQVEERFGGSAQAQLETYAGQWKSIKNQWREIQEFLGYVFLKTIEAVLVGIGMIGTVFYTATESVLQGLTWLTDGLGKLARMAGMTETSKAIFEVAGGLRTAAQNATDAKDASMNMVASNMKSFTAMKGAVDTVSDAIEKMGIKGKKTMPILDDAAKGFLKSQLEANKAAQDANNKMLESAMTTAQHQAEIARQAYKNESDIAWDLYDQKTEAIDKWYDEAAKLIEEQVNLEAKNAKVGFDIQKVKYEKLNALDQDYAKKREGADIEIDKSSYIYQQRRIAVEADLYKTINQFSDDSVKATIMALEERYKREGTFTEKSLLLEKALEEARQQLWLGKDRVIYEYYERTKVYAENADDLLQKLALAEYTRVYKATQDAKIAEKAKLDYIIEANIKKAEAMDDFWQGVKAAYDKDRNNLYTWGQAGIDMFRHFSEESSRMVSDILFDGMKGQMKDFADYWHSFVDSMLRMFTDIVAKMLIQWALFGDSIQTTLGKLFGGGIGGGGGTGLATGGLVGLFNNLMGGGEGPSIENIEAESQAYKNLWETGSVGAAAGATAGGGGIGSSLSGLSSVKSAIEGAQKIYSWFSGGLAGLTSGAATFTGAGSAFYGGGAAGLEMLTGTGIELGSGIGAGTGATAGAAGTTATVAGAGMSSMLAGAGVAGVALAAILGHFGQSNAGIGSRSTVGNIGQIGGYPSWGPWSQMEGAAGSAPSDLLLAFMQNTNEAIQATYQTIADYLNTLDPAKKLAVVKALAAANIRYLPDAVGFTYDVGAGTTSLAMTREQIPMIPDYLRAIPSYIMAQINPIIGAVTGASLKAPSYTLDEMWNAMWKKMIEPEQYSDVHTSMSGSSGPLSDKQRAMFSRYGLAFAKEGLDYVPYDNFLASLHKGERVQTASERSDLAAEVRQLTEKIEAIGLALAKNSVATMKILKQWDGNGIPAERVLA